MPTPSFHLRPAATLETIWPTAPEIAPATTPAMASTARPLPNVATTNAAIAMPTTRLTQKPGSVSSLVTNSNAALSFSATQLAALLIAPQSPPSFFSGSFCAAALTFAWPSEIFPDVLPGASLALPAILPAWASILPLVSLRPPWNLPLTLPTVLLSLPPSLVTAPFIVVTADLAAAPTLVPMLDAVFDAPAEALAAACEAELAVPFAVPPMDLAADFAAPVAPWEACLATLPPATIAVEAPCLSSCLTS